MSQEPRTAAPAARFLAGLRRRGRQADPRLAAGIATRLLVVKPHDQLGDFLVATPFLAELRGGFPDARITLVTRAYLAPLARRQPAVDEVVLLPDARALPGFVRGLRAPRPDAAFVLNSVSRSRTADLVALASGARWIVGRSRVGAGPVAAGPRADRDPVYDDDLDMSAGAVHQVDRLLDLLRSTVGGTGEAMTLAVRADERARGLAALGEAQGARIGLHPTAANALKRWPLESFIELAARLARLGHTPVVFDTPKEPGPARALREALEGRGLDARFVAAGELDDFIPVVSALDLMVCNDSGVMHVAAALGVPTVSFHSLGRPEEWAPRSRTAIALHAERIAVISIDDAERAARSLL